MKVRILSKFAWVARTGRLKARVTADEQGVVAIGGTLRPGPGVRRRGRVVRVDRKVLRLRASVVGYQAPGTRTVTIRLPRVALTRLAHARSLRVSINLVGVDLARNQASSALKVTLTRTRKVAQLRHTRARRARTAVHSRG